MKNNKTLLSACITALFCSTLAQAASFDEEAWKKTKSYADVPVSEDSAGEWGPWAAFVEPAAGGPSINPLAFIGAGSGGPYRNLPETQQQLAKDTFCGTGNWCGYAIFTAEQGGPKRSKREQMSPEYQAGLFALTLTPGMNEQDGPMPAARYVSEGYAPTYPGTASWILGSLDGQQVAASSEMYADFGGGSYSPAEGKWIRINKRNIWIETRAEGDRYDNRDDELHHFWANGEGENGYASVSGFSQNRKATEATDAIPDTEMVIGYDLKWSWKKGFYWEPVTKMVAPFTDAIRKADDQVAIGQLFAYTYGNDSFDESQPYKVSGSEVRGYYVAGIATAQNQLDALRVNNITASYKGGSFDGTRQGYVSMDVNFGTATWNGSWVGGMDAQAMNFNASGTINGANLASNSVSANQYNANNVSYAGNVSGSFYGNNAASIGGVSSIQKSVDNVVTQTQNAVFLVNKTVDPR